MRRSTLISTLLALLLTLALAPSALAEGFDDDHAMDNDGLMGDEMMNDDVMRDDDEAMDSDVMNARFDEPTLDELVMTSGSIVVADITSSSRSVAECKAFFGATYDVDEVLRGDAPARAAQRMGSVHRFEREECSGDDVEQDALQRVSNPFPRGGQILILHDTEWGDVFLPIEARDDVEATLDLI